MGKPVILSHNNNWEYTYHNLYKYKNGKIINYTVRELQATKQYTKTQIRENNTIILVNTYNPDTIQIKITKEWEIITMQTIQDLNK